LHLAIAPVGSVVSDLPDTDPLDVLVVVVGVGEAVVVFVGVLDAGAGVVLAAVVAVGAAGVVGAVRVPAVPTPPWCEHAPRPAVPIVPSLHVTDVPDDVVDAAGVVVDEVDDFVAAAGCGAGAAVVPDAVLFTPP